MTIQANAQHLPGLELAWAELHAAGYQPGDAPHKILSQAIASASNAPTSAPDERDVLLAEARMVIAACMDESDLPLELDWMCKRASNGRRIYVDDRALAGSGMCQVCDAAIPAKDIHTPAARDVLAERQRQITAKGWTPAHDDLYCAAELPRAAASYILNGANDEAPAIWPFASKWWKPRDSRANYIRAGALILAEIERLDRGAAKAAQQEQQP